MLMQIIIGGALLIIAELVEHFVELPEWASVLIFLPAYAVVGYTVLYSAFRNICHGQIFDENFLMAVASIGSIIVGDCSEAAVVMLVYKIGTLFESIAVGKSRRSISELMDIRPEYANLVTDSGVEQVDPETVKIGDIIELHAGERIPLDGVVISGSGDIDNCALTGESVPLKAREGDNVMSGAVNLNGVMQLRVTAEYSNSTVARVLELVENSVSKKAKSEKFITRFAKYYTPAVCGIALALALIPPIFVGNIGEWVHRALTLLVISCPCALVISVPLSFFAGLGAAGRSGILIKGSDYIERLAKLKTLVFDKTGTLTNGSFSVVAVHPEKISEIKLLELAARVECFSDHPISRSITEAYGKIPEREGITDIKEISGEGISAVVDGKNVLVGNGKLMESNNIPWHKCSKNGTQVHVAFDGNYAGHIVIYDELKTDSKSAIKDLRKHGVNRIVMLTGDGEGVASEVAKTLEISDYHSGLLPADKVELTEKAKRDTENGFTGFVGDGINDAPVLACADVGISMGLSGSQAAIEASDVVLTDDNPSKIAGAIRIARSTMAIVYQNIIFSLAIKVLVIILGAFGIAHMWLAVFADVGVMILAVLNSLRALRAK